MRCGSRHSGFTYLAVLFIVAAMGLGAAQLGVIWHTVQQRDKEQELLFVGDQFRKAIGLYYQRTPGGAKRYPESLEQLLSDERYPAVQRYLRKIYIDPMSGKAEWGMVPAPGGGVMGVYSLSVDTPIKQANFAFRDGELEGKQKYSDWQFIYVPPGQGIPAPGAVVKQTGN